MSTWPRLTQFASLRHRDRHLRFLSWLDYGPARDVGRNALPPVHRCDLTSCHVHRTGRYKLIRDVARDEGQLVSDNALGDRG